MQDHYKTIASPSEGLYKEKGSKFLAFAYPVFSEGEAEEKLKGLKKQYHDARHHVYAFRLGADMEHYRASDDGEPSNSSGPPVLGQIRSFGLTNTLVVVVRYFGGTKLGVPGLIHAYKTAAANALGAAKVVTRTVDDEVHIRFGYPDSDKVLGMVKRENYSIVHQKFEVRCELRFRIPKNQTEGFVAQLLKLPSVEHLD